MRGACAGRAQHLLPLGLAVFSVAGGTRWHLGLLVPRDGSVWGTKRRLRQVENEPHDSGVDVWASGAAVYKQDTWAARRLAL